MSVTYDLCTKCCITCVCACVHMCIVCVHVVCVCVCCVVFFTGQSFRTYIGQKQYANQQPAEISTQQQTEKKTPSALTHPHGNQTLIPLPNMAKGCDTYQGRRGVGMWGGVGCVRGVTLDSRSSSASRGGRVSRGTRSSGLRGDGDGGCGASGSGSGGWGRSGRGSHGGGPS